MNLPLHLGEESTLEGEPICLYMEDKYGGECVADGWSKYTLTLPGVTFTFTVADDPEAAKIAVLMKIITHGLPESEDPPPQVTNGEFLVALADLDNPHDGLFRILFQRRAESTSREPIVTEG